MFSNVLEQRVMGRVGILGRFGPFFDYVISGGKLMKWQNTLTPVLCAMHVTVFAGFDWFNWTKKSLWLVINREGKKIYGYTSLWL